MKHPKLIENHYLDALKQMENSEALHTLYREETATPCADIQKLMDGGNIYAMEDAIAGWQVKAEAMGFLLGYRYAMQLAREVFA